MQQAQGEHMYRRRRRTMHEPKRQHNSTLFRESLDTACRSAGLRQAAIVVLRRIPENSLCTPTWLSILALSYELSPGC